MLAHHTLLFFVAIPIAIGALERACEAKRIYCFFSKSCVLQMTAFERKIRHFGTLKHDLGKIFRIDSILTAILYRRDRCKSMKQMFWK